MVLNVIHFIVNFFSGPMKLWLVFLYSFTVFMFVYMSIVLWALLRILPSCCHWIIILLLARTDKEWCSYVYIHVYMHCYSWYLRLPWFHLWDGSSPVCYENDPMLSVYMYFRSGNFFCIRKCLHCKFLHVLFSPPGKWRENSNGV